MSEDTSVGQLISENKRKCLAVACSPRKNGNTAILAKQALKGAAEAGAETELIYLVDYKFSPCRACGGCNKNGRCVVKDEVMQIYDKVLSAESIILAAPIFSMGICAQAKNFIDRAQQFWATKFLLQRNVIENEEKRKARRGIYLSAAGTNFPDVFDGAVQVAKYFFSMLEIKLLGSHCYPKIDLPGDVNNYPEILQEVFVAGKMLGKG
ncbi:NADPH-dependent FMN reductase [Desulfofarcimen acetoxidans DSM 771]|uniref:NADPH-dependent FMN reductase n=1 Tax=Desulfofarcimen acetoxidans (strain ATCC 49208 / DSM 771 / KCTC 5769 / VKM B-1644 / 5575) TaxID=485916 RepID=C8VZ39_DESAS|nr:flavodoxin family protein [Desulfofarcimen acetoxidans]ACV62949.1 NADPH-dependent FMN reductase [Desulfofarcimen acetoxidans DSM 771]